MQQRAILDYEAWNPEFILVLYQDSSLKISDATTSYPGLRGVKIQNLSWCCTRIHLLKYRMQQRAILDYEAWKSRIAFLCFDYPGCKKIIQFHKLPTSAQLFQRLSRLQEDNPVSQASSLGRSYFKRIIQVARRLSSFTNFLLRAQLFQRSLSRLHEDYPVSQTSYFGRNYFKEAYPGCTKIIQTSYFALQIRYLGYNFF